MQTMVQKQIKACIMSYIRGRRTARMLDKAGCPEAAISARDLAAYSMMQARKIRGNGL